MLSDLPPEVREALERAEEIAAAARAEQTPEDAERVRREAKRECAKAMRDGGVVHHIGDRSTKAEDEAEDPEAQAVKAIKAGADEQTICAALAATIRVAVNTPIRRCESRHRRRPGSASRRRRGSRRSDPRATRAGPGDEPDGDGEPHDVDRGRCR